MKQPEAIVPSPLISTLEVADIDSIVESIVLSNLEEDTGAAPESPFDRLLSI